jgi:hypothetical protein
MRAATHPGENGDTRVLRGFHGTWLEHVASIVHEGRIREGYWKVLFWHSSATALQPRMLYDYFNKVRTKVPRREIYVEIESTCGYRKHTGGGGHSQEELACRYAGVCRYVNSSDQVLRTTAKSNAVTIRAIWVPHGTDMDSFRAAIGFSA